MLNHGVDPFGIVGQVLDGQFRIDRLVGEGGFSAVYRGHHLGLQEPIAIKCLKLPPSLSPPLVDEFAKRFRDEGRILYRLSQGNLNIVRSIAAGTWQANTGAVVPYMILEWMDGRSLANELTIRRTVGQQGWPLREVVKVFGPAADGLGYAHSQGVVHRDLNPGNLFLAATPQGTRMKVLDFGVAKILDDSTLNIARTQTVGAIRIFAPAYGAPEQFDDAIGPVSAATDVYAFALILLEALRDRSVNDGQHLGEFAQRAVDPARRPTPRALGLAVPDEVEQIFARATKLDPRERWQSAGELWQALAIAASAASRDRHAQAAAETPSLAMPTGARSTRQGIAPPPNVADSQLLPRKTPATVRMDKTVPIGSVMPNIPAAHRPGAGTSAEVPVLHGPEDGEDMPTKVGAGSPQVALSPQVPGSSRPHDDVGLLSEPEDDVTHVRAPESDILHGLAGSEARGRGANMHARAPRPAAGRLVAPEVVPPSGGTSMLIANAHLQGLAPTHPMEPPTQPAEPPKQNLALTMPLVGAHPLGNSARQPSSSGPAPAAGTPGGQQPQPQWPLLQQPQPQQSYPPHGPSQQQQYQQMQQAMLQGQPHVPMHGGQQTFGPQGHGGRMADAVSMPPASAAGVPKKDNTMLFVGIGLGALGLIGLALTLVVVLGAKGEGKGAASSASVPSSSIPIASAPPPAPTTAPEPPPAPAVVTADASDTARIVDAKSASTSPSTTTTATTTARIATPPTPTLDVVAPPRTVAVVKAAGPPADPNEFSESAARSRLGQANGVLAFCKKTGGPTGPGSATVTFVPEGTVSEVTINPPYAATPVGDCVAGQLKRTKINPYKGVARSLKHTFEVPK